VTATLALEVPQRRARHQRKSINMKQALKPFWGILIIVSAVAVVFGISTWMQPDEIVQWRTDLNAARAESEKTSRPIFAYFTADWCEACRAMKHTTWADPKVDGLLHGYIAVKVDVDRNPELGLKYHIDEGMPLMAVMDAEGKVKKKYNGALAPDDFVLWLATDAKEESDLPQ
jgi:thiol:disulfide interchange protein